LMFYICSLCYRSQWGVQKARKTGLFRNRPRDRGLARIGTPAQLARAVEHLLDAHL
jgi:hypothetical protein